MLNAFVKILGINFYLRKVITHQFFTFISQMILCFYGVLFAEVISFQYVILTLILNIFNTSKNLQRESYTSKNLQTKT